LAGRLDLWDQASGSDHQQSPEHPLAHDHALRNVRRPKDVLFARSA
jgi:hypothetical protein